MSFTQRVLPARRGLTLRGRGLLLILIDFAAPPIYRGDCCNDPRCDVHRHYSEIRIRPIYWITTSLPRVRHQTEKDECS